MRESVRFAASFLSVVLATSAFAADLRPAKDPYLIDRTFPATSKVRLVNLWATWCRPCVSEMADLRAVRAAFGKELAITGVSIDDMIPDTKPEQVEAFLDKHNIAYPNVYYTGNPETLGRYYDFNGAIPLTILFDAEGQELWRKRGPIQREETVAKIRELLGRKK
jgi:thiol-disulfide isomerase/thioredoxin